MDSRPQEALWLASSESTSKWNSPRDIRRTLERWQTKTFVHELMVKTGAGSVYALEEMMMKGCEALTFPEDRPKLCDRMASRGEPAIVKQLGRDRRKDLRTQRWIERLLALAPDAAEVLRHPIWRLLDPQPLPYIEWHALGIDHMNEAARDASPMNAWLIAVEPENPRDEPLHFVPCVGESPTRIDMTTLLLGLRRWETQGDLIAYDLYLQEILAVARYPRAHASLQALQPDVADYVAQTYGRVHVPHGPLNLAAQKERIQVARQAWARRVLIDKSSGEP